MPQQEELTFTRKCSVEIIIIEVVLIKNSDNSDF